MEPTARLEISSACLPQHAAMAYLYLVRRMKARHLALALFALCVSAVPVMGAPRMSQAEVIRVADAAARRAGYNLSEYSRSAPSLDRELKMWIITYDKHPDKNGMTEVGAHFFINVDDGTGKAGHQPGR